MGSKIINDIERMEMKTRGYKVNPEMGLLKEHGDGLIVLVKKLRGFLDYNDNNVMVNSSLYY